MLRHNRRSADIVSRRFPTLVLVESDRKSTRLNSSHANISYAVFCLKKKYYFSSFLSFLPSCFLLSPLSSAASSLPPLPTPPPFCTLSLPHSSLLSLSSPFLLFPLPL